MATKLTKHLKVLASLGHGPSRLNLFKTRSGSRPDTDNNNNNNNGGGGLPTQNTSTSHSKFDKKSSASSSSTTTMTTVDSQYQHQHRQLQQAENSEPLKHVCSSLTEEMSSLCLSAGDNSFAEHSPLQNKDYEERMDEGHHSLIETVCLVLLNMMDGYLNHTHVADLPPGSPPNKGSMSPKTRWKEVMLHLVRPGSAAFDGEHRRVLKQLRQLIDDLQLYSDAAPPCMIIALVYLDQIVQQDRVILSRTTDQEFGQDAVPTMSSAMMDFVRYFAVCLALASKVYEDRYLSNADWVWVFNEVVDISLVHFSRIETQVLLDLGFSLVTPFPKMIAAVERWNNTVPELIHGPDYYTSLRWYISTFHSDYENL